MIYRALLGMIFSFSENDIAASFAMIYSQKNCPKDNITRRKSDIIAQQYHSPLGEYNYKVMVPPFEANN